MYQKHPILSAKRQNEDQRSAAFAEDKASALQGWEDRKKVLSQIGRRGGVGYVDLDIVPLCDALNRLSGVCTLQSCAGHPVEDSDGVASSGALWVRLSPVVASRFEAKAHQLAGNYLIERVGKIYWEDGKETVTISFKGNECGLLASSCSVIFEFFQRISD